MSTTGVKRDWALEYYAEPMTAFATLAAYFTVRIDQSLENMDSYYKAWQLYCLEKQPAPLTAQHYSNFISTFCHLERDCRIAITKHVQQAFKLEDVSLCLDRLLLLHQLLTTPDLAIYGKSLNTYVPNAPQHYLPGFSALGLTEFPSLSAASAATNKFKFP